ncbi:HNH endonuclease [Candidatus Entotheonella palauensis]|uniref:HNH endonuclease n=1 Tax=Candidatus Entotheonella palauensis TaxID=93172 RepID=UPI000558C809|nr:HNH endonuclease [Candidatus Entotheonella palauensis]
MSTYLSEILRQQLVETDDHRCAYCQTTQANTGQPMVVDHIVPETQGGRTEFDNLCFACRRCNEFKGATTRTHDPLTDELTPLYHPRQHSWADHFSWDGSGIQLLGLTAIGRSTIVALNINNEVAVAARRRWVSVGWHPPEL